MTDAEVDTLKLLEQTEQVYGSDSIQALSVRFDYAGVAWERRDLDRAELEYKHVIKTLTDQGSPSVDMRASKSNLAQILMEIGKVDEAQSILESAISDAERDQDAEAALPLMRFARARLLSASGDYLAAIQEMKSIRDDCAALFGLHHDRTISVTHELGVTFQESGDLKSAIPILRDALNSRVQELGPRHPDTLSSMHQLGLALHEDGQFIEAREYYEAALDGRSRALGPHNESTLATRYQIAGLNLVEGREGSAQVEFEDILAVEVRILGLNHPNTLKTRATVAAIMFKKGKVASAVKEFESIYRAWSTILGENHNQTRSAWNDLQRISLMAHFYKGSAGVESWSTDAP